MSVASTCVSNDLVCSPSPCLLSVLFCWENLWFRVLHFVSWEFFTLSADSPCMLNALYLECPSPCLLCVIDLVCQESFILSLECPLPCLASVLHLVCQVSLALSARCSLPCLSTFLYLVCRVSFILSVVCTCLLSHFRLAHPWILLKNEVSKRIIIFLSHLFLLIVLRTNLKLKVPKNHFCTDVQADRGLHWSHREAQLPLQG